MSVPARRSRSAAPTAPYSASKATIGPASTRNPAAAGTMTTSVSRNPRENSSRTPSWSPEVQRSANPGSRTVKMETATIAWGSEKKTKACEYAVYAPSSTRLAR